MSQKKSEYPECDKLDKAHATIVAFLQFLEWASSEKKVFLCEYNKEYEAYFLTSRAEDLLYEFFGIDQTKLEQERRAMLDKLRKEQGMR